MADYFISYNSADEAKAEWIAWTLRNAGLSVRFAKWELRAGDSIAAWMAVAMEDSERMIAVCSPDYYKPGAPYSAMERQGFVWDVSAPFGGTIINCVVRAVKIPKLYAPLLRIDLTGIDEAEAKARLIGALAMPGPPAAPPPWTPEPAAPPFKREPEGQEPVPVAPNRSYSGWFGFLSLAGLVGLVSADDYAGGLVLDHIWRGVTGAWLPVLLVALYAAMAWAINAGLDAPDSRRWIATTLRLDSGGELYRSVMRRVLDWIDRNVSWEQQAQGKPPEHWGIAFSPRLFEGCLLLALFYPIYSVFAVWAVTDQPGMVGSVVIVPGGQEPWVRAATIGGLASALIFGQLSKWRRAQGKVTQAHLFLGLAAFAAFASAFASAFTFAAFTFAASAFAAFASAGFGAFAFAAFAASAFAASASAFAASAVIGYAFFRKRSIGRWGGRALGQFITIALASATAAETARLAGLDSDAKLVFVLPVFLGFFFWVAKGFEAVLEAGPRRFGGRGLFQAAYAIALAYALALIAGDVTNANGKPFLLFLGFLPLVNAVFDFASIGLTRLCLRRGLRPGFLNALKWSLIDAAGAVVLFAGLVLSAIYTVHYVRDANGAPLASLNEIFTGIARDPGSYWWLYLTFFSTLVPTLLHLGVACFSFIALAPASLQQRVAGWIGAMDRDGFANLGARAVLPLIATLSVALPFLALYALGLWIAGYHGEIGGMFFRLALGFAGWLDPKYVEGVDAILTGSPG